jgi:hypothetical protein
VVAVLSGHEKRARSGIEAIEATRDPASARFVSGVGAALERRHVR